MLAATGLYGIPELSDPAGFQLLTDQAIARTEELIDAVVAAPRGLQTISLIDEISDTVSRVCDAAHLCSSTHPQASFVAAANQSYLRLMTYVTRLNAHRPLYSALKEAMDTRAAAAEAAARAGGQATTSERDAEADRVGAALLHDFVRGGVHLPQEQRDRVEELAEKVTQAGIDFCANLTNPSLSETFSVNQAVLARMPKRLRGMAGRGGVLRARDVYGGEKVEDWVLRHVDDEDTRRAAYLAGYSSPANNHAVLDDIVQGRYELARQLQAESHGHFVIPPLMAGSPAAVGAFLEQLSAALKPAAQAELDSLRRLKQIHTTGTTRGPLPELRGWDQQFYERLAKAQHQLPGRSISEYLPLHRCIDGFCMLSERLFCTTLKRVPMAPGETWAPDVQKLEACHSTEGVLGHLYLDLNQREGKYNHSAMFTLRASHAKRDGGYQPSLLALVCNFGNGVPGATTLLSSFELETLFHELGHAMHTLLSRTHFQHFSGCRGPMDFVEVPSHLMEYFAWDEAVLATFAKHHRTNEPVPPQLLHDMRSNKNRFAAMDMQTQVVIGMYDQVCHSATPPARGGGMTAALAEVRAAHSALPHEPGSAWQLRFGHITTYSAVYYSYTYAQCMSATLWGEMFAGDPLAPGAGERLRTEVLRHGGSRDPAQMMRALLGERAITSAHGGCYPAAGLALREMGLRAYT